MKNIIKRLKYNNTESILLCTLYMVHNWLINLNNNNTW